MHKERSNIGRQRLFSISALLLGMTLVLIIPGMAFSDNDGHADPQVSKSLKKGINRLMKYRGGFFLRFYGSGIFSNGADFQRVVAGNTPIYENRKIINDTERPREYLGYSELEKSTFFQGFGLELGYQFKKFSLALESGRTNRFLNTTSVYPEYLGPWNIKFSGIPIMLNFSYDLFKNSVLKVQVHAGTGIYLGKFKERAQLENEFVKVEFKGMGFWARLWTYDELYAFLEEHNLERSYMTWHTNSQEITPAFQAGTTIDLNLSRHWGLYCRAGYTWARFSSIKATIDFEDDFNQYNQEGDLFINIRQEDGLVVFTVAEPLPEGFTSRKATFNLNGFSLVIGIRYSFF